MPVIRIQAIRTKSLDVEALLERVSAAVAGAFSLELAQCWSCFTEIMPGEMFEGGRFRDATGRHSPLVTLSAYRGRTPEEVRCALEAVADEVVDAFGFADGDVFVEYREINEGEVYTGGSVR